MNVIKTCPYCGKEFETHNPRKIFCQLKCKNADHYLHRKPKTRTCAICDKEFTDTTQKKTCSLSCQEEYVSKAKEAHRQKNLERIDESLCFSCARAYSKPFEAGGCEKFFSNVVCYNRADYWCYENQGKTLVCISVTDCDLYVRGRRIENQKET